MRVTDAVARHAWTLQRFGLTPRKLVARLRNNREPKILCVSLPKAGTHLLERALCLHPRLYRKVLPTFNDNNIRRWGGLGDVLAKLRPGQILISHLHFRPEYRSLLHAGGTRCIFLIRDPRDIIVSQSFYVAADRKHHLHQLFHSEADPGARLRIAIAGDSAYRLPSIGQRLTAFSGWLEASDLVVRYEDLVGGAGGGDVAVQQATLRSIYRSVDLSPDEGFFNSLTGQLFSRVSPTFRKGTTGQWRQHFDPELEELFRANVGSELDRYGYRDNPPA